MDKLHDQMTEAGLPITGLYTTADGIGIHWAETPTPAQAAQAAAMIASYDPQTEAIIQQMTTALEVHIDTTAQQRDYENGDRCVGWVDCGNPVWDAEARAFRAWRRAAYEEAFSIMADVQAGTLPLPTVPEFIAMLPPMVWPE